jgi:hypothetical protein
MEWPSCERGLTLFQKFRHEWRHEKTRWGFTLPGLWPREIRDSHTARDMFPCCNVLLPHILIGFSPSASQLSCTTRHGVVQIFHGLKKDRREKDGLVSPSHGGIMSWSKSHRRFFVRSVYDTHKLSFFFAGLLTNYLKTKLLQAIVKGINLPSHYVEREWYHPSYHMHLPRSLFSLREHVSHFLGVTAGQDHSLHGVAVARKSCTDTPAGRPKTQSIWFVFVCLEHLQPCPVSPSPRGIWVRRTKKRSQH